MTRSRRGRTIGRARRLTVTLLLAALLPAGYSQNWITSTGTSAASVALSGTAQVESSIRLRIGAATLIFDLTLSGPEAPTCSASTEQDAPVLMGGFVSANMVKPLGTTPRLEGADLASVEGGAPVTASDIPLPPGAGEVVCYHAFPLQLFSNTPGWQLIVDRNDELGLPSIERLYVGSTCGADPVEGLWLLPNLQRVTLLQGMQVSSCPEVVIVLAVALGSHPAGTSAAALRYSLLSADQPQGPGVR